VQRAQGFFDSGQSKSSSYLLGKRILTLGRCSKALFHEAPQPTAAESTEAPIERNDARNLLIDLFDLGVDQLQAAAALLPYLAKKVELGFILEPPVDPALVEPHDLEVAPAIIDQTVDDVHFAIRDPANPRSQHPAPEEYPRTHVEMSVQADDLSPILVATRQVEEKVEHRMDALGGKRLAAPWANALEPRQWVVGAEGIFDCGQSASISKRH
jgi:hypothetical protein